MHFFLIFKNETSLKCIYQTYLCDIGSVCHQMQPTRSHTLNSILEMQQVTKGDWCVCCIWYFFIWRKWFVVSDFVISTWNISANKFVFQEILSNLCWIWFAFKKFSSPLLLWRWSLNRTVFVSIEFIPGNFDRLQESELLLLAKFDNSLAHFGLWKSREALSRHNEA